MKPPPGSPRLGKEDVYSYVQGLTEHVAPLFPNALFGTGGDEMNLACYGANSSSEIDASGIKPLVQRAHNTVSKLDKTPMVWEGDDVGLSRDV